MPSLAARFRHSYPKNEPRFHWYAEDRVGRALWYWRETMVQGRIQTIDCRFARHLKPVRKAEEIRPGFVGTRGSPTQLHALFRRWETGKEGCREEEAEGKGGA